MIIQTVLLCTVVAMACTAATYLVVDELAIKPLQAVQHEFTMLYSAAEYR